MPYIGKQLSNGNYLKLDDISSQFNGSKVTFSLTNGGSAYYPGSELSILVSVGGVIQEPESAYQISNDEITFANAPTAQDSFFCVVLGDAIGINVPGNNTVNGAQMAKPFNYDGGLLYLDDTNNKIGINNTSPTVALDITGDLKVSGNITGIGGTLGGTLVGNVYASSGISTFNDLRVTNNLTVEGTTTTLDTNLIGVDRVEVGANSNSVVGVAITQSGTADILQLFDGSTKVVTIDDEGKVGVGTDAPAEALEIGKGHTDPVIRLNDVDNRRMSIRGPSANNIASVGTESANDLMFFTNGYSNEKLRITSAGKVGIGTVSPNQPVSITNGRVNIDVKNDYYGVWADGDTQGENHISVGRWHNTGGSLKSGYTAYGINNLILENNHPTAAHTLIIQPKGQKVAIGTHISDGLVHIGQTSAGTVSADADADELVLESSGNTGMSILSPGTGESSIYFGNPGTNGEKDGWIKYYHETHSTTANRRNLVFNTATNERLRITSGGNIDVNGTPPWSVTGGDYRNLSISGQVANSGGFVWLGNGAATTNADHDLGRINFCNGATITSQIAGSTQTSANDDGRITFSTKATGGSLEEQVRITSAGRMGIGAVNPTYALMIQGAGNAAAGMYLYNNTGAEGIKIVPESNGNCRIYTSTNDILCLGTNNADIITIGTGGNVGINESSPDRELHISNNTTGGIIRLTNTDTTITDGTICGMLEFEQLDSNTPGVSANIRAEMQDTTNGSNQICFSTGTPSTIGTRMVIDPKGRVLIGTNSSSYAYSSLVVEGNATFGGGTGTLQLQLGSANPSSAGSGLGEIRFTDSNESCGAVIKGESAAAWSNGSSYPGYLSFKTTASSATSSTERLRIDHNGRLLLGAGAISLPKGTGAGSFDLDNGYITMCIGGNVNSTGRSNSTDKLNRITSPHYTNAEEPVALVSSYNVSGNNSISYGGGSSLTNAATVHSFYTAANNTTTNGTERLRIDANGRIRLGGDPAGTTISALDVTGGTSTITDVMLVKGNAGNGFIRFQDNDVTCNWTMGVDDGSGIGANGFIWYDRINAQYRLSIDNDGDVRVWSGKLGVGIDPTEQLHVQKNHNGHTRAVIQNNWGANATAQLKLVAPTDELQIVKYASGDASINLSNSADINFSIGGSERFIIHNDGTLELKNNTGKMIDCRTTSGTGSNYIQLSDSAGNQKGYFGYGSSSSEQLYIVQQESADIVMYTGSASRWYYKTDGQFQSATNGGINVHGGGVHHDNDAVIYCDKTNDYDWGIVSNTGGTDYGMYARVGNSAAYGIGVYDHTNSTWRFRVNGSGGIYATSTTITSISDVRLKENIVDANSQWDDIKALRFRNFKWKADSGYADGKTYLGLISQEVEPISPNLVEINAQTKEDIENEVPDPEYKNVKYSIVWMKAVKALQEAQARIETLEAKVAALEGS